MGKNRPETHLVCYEEGGKVYKICRILFGKDASLYVTSSYHKIATATLVKQTINYQTSHSDQEVLDIGHSADSTGRIKLTHHADGFVQFSGEGIVSGKDKATGAIRGIGVFSFTLDRPVRGPTFGITATGIEQFTSAREGDFSSCSFRRSELAVPDNERLIYFVEGHVFPWAWRRFVYKDHNGNRMIDIAHPTGAVLKMKVVLPPDSYGLSYFLGMEMYALPFMPGTLERSFIFGGATGDIRKNEKGETLATSIHCIYPRGSRTGRDLDFRMTSTY